MIAKQINQLAEMHRYFEIRYCADKDGYWQYYGPDNEDVTARTLKQLLDDVMELYKY